MSESIKKKTTKKSPNTNVDKGKNKVVKHASFDKANELLKKDEVKNSKPKQVVKKDKVEINKEKVVEKEKIDQVKEEKPNISEVKLEEKTNSITRGLNQEIVIRPKRTVYFSYQFRLFLHIILFFVLVGSFGYLLFKYIKINSADIINYTENGTINYRVLLKDNKYYDDKYVDQDMMYVANLIDKIDIKYNYDFIIDREVDCEFNYDIIAYLVVKDGTSDKVYLNKKYDIEVNNSEKMSGGLKHNFNKNVVIDYQYYNLLASRFKGELGVDTESYLRVMLNINKSSEDVSINDSRMFIDIPLSQRAFNITISPMKLNNYSQTVKEESVEYGDKIYLVLLILDGVIILFVLMRFGKLLSKSFGRKTKYQKYIAKLLREYDRLIVEVAKSPDMSNYNVVKISEFKELLDVRDNLKLPIMFHELIKNQKAYFYIKNDNNVYLYIVKDVDMK